MFLDSFTPPVLSAISSVRPWLLEACLLIRDLYSVFRTSYRYTIAPQVQKDEHQKEQRSIKIGHKKWSSSDKDEVVKPTG